jgi:predicted RNase H-like nuclease
LGLLHVDGGKKIWRGQRARLRVLEAAGIYLPEDLGQAVARVPADDVLDAAAAAWTAHRIAHDVVECLPDPPQRNVRGQSIAIWY